jgi:hypothetical protein
MFDIFSVKNNVYLFKNEKWFININSNHYFATDWFTVIIALCIQYIFDLIFIINTSLSIFLPVPTTFFLNLIFLTTFLNHSSYEIPFYIIKSLINILRTPPFLHFIFIKPIVLCRFCYLILHHFHHFYCIIRLFICFVNTWTHFKTKNPLTRFIIHIRILSTLYFRPSCLLYFRIINSIFIYSVSCDHNVAWPKITSCYEQRCMHLGVGVSKVYFRSKTDQTKCAWTVLTIAGYGGANWRTFSMLTIQCSAYMHWFLFNRAM